MEKYSGILEEELKLRVAEDYFPQYDCTRRVDNIDFWVKDRDGLDYTLLWAEAKAGREDLTDALVQLILTIGRHQTYTRHIAPAWLGAFNADGISFIPYSAVMGVFHENDFNWKVTPSNHSTAEFTRLRQMVASAISDSRAGFQFGRDDRELRDFIRHAIAGGTTAGTKLRISKSTFVSVFYKWLTDVMPSININWDDVRRSGILPRDFYLADLLADNGHTLPENLAVVLEQTSYRLDSGRLLGGQPLYTNFNFSDGQAAYNKFWNRYQRPPEREYWKYIMERIDLLVPQDIRERKGSFFTPQVWVRKSQECLADYLGDDWQDRYYVWDCCAGTGNMEVGLTNKYHLWASTLDQPDVAIMHERIRNGANMLDAHVFQFDFLNGDFGELPGSLREVISNPEKRSRLVVYINPPYAEASNARQICGSGENRDDLANCTRTYARYAGEIGTAGRELYAQFLYRIYKEIPGCIIANFSKLKSLQGPNFEKFRNCFQPKLERLFIVPACTFDNVKGKFPIGFFIWNGARKEKFTGIRAEVYGADGIRLGSKTFEPPKSLMVAWLRKFYDDDVEKPIGYLRLLGSDMQHNNDIFITSQPSPNDIRKSLLHKITPKNVVEMCMYNSIRHCIDDTWINDRDIFHSPNDSWRGDRQFQHDCLIYTLFHNSNNIRSAAGVNHWIPFSEGEVDAREAFDSHFMSDYLKGLYRPAGLRQDDLFAPSPADSAHGGAIELSAEAMRVLNAGRALWQHYHAQRNAIPNASFYDIREHFQGRDGHGRMNGDSPDAKYNALLRDLRKAMKDLGDTIAEKVYIHGFLTR